MRLSCRKGDPGFDLVLTGDRHVHVFLDGRDICAVCHTADEELGEAHVYKINAQGQKYRDPETRDAAQEILHGRIEIRATDTTAHRDVENRLTQMFRLLAGGDL